MIIDDAIGHPATFRFSAKAQELKAQGREIISLGLGEPDFDTPEHIKQAAAEALRAGFTRYSEGPGLPELREAVARKLQSDNGIRAEAEEILITPGAKNALFLACAALLRPGDEVINLTPCYVSNLPILKLAEPEVVVHEAPLMPPEFALDQDLILSLVNDRTKLLFINYPNNPTGRMLTEAEAEFIRELACRRGLYVLSDEVYERLTLTDRQPISPASFPELCERVVTVNGFSKAYAMTGWRIGYLHAPKEIFATALSIHQHLNTNTATFVQKAALAALTGPQHHLRDFLSRLKARVARWEDFLAQPPRLTGSRVEGGFFGFLDIASSGLSSDEFATGLLEETGVAVTPGVSFGADFDHWIRVSLATASDRLQEGLKRIAGYVSQGKGR